MIQANESGKPKIRGVADENIVYPGQIRKIEISIITEQKIHLDFREVDFFSA